MAEVEIAIVGRGPAGLTAALYAPGARRRRGVPGGYEPVRALYFEIMCCRAFVAGVDWGKASPTMSSLRCRLSSPSGGDPDLAHSAATAARGGGDGYRLSAERT